MRLAQAPGRSGREPRSIYPVAFLDEGHVHEAAWVRDWADVGERAARWSSRCRTRSPCSATSWSSPAPQWGRRAPTDLVAIRAPLLVQSFIAVFDEAWRAGLPVPHVVRTSRTSDRLLAMLASGLKDEAIARYLGVSLRTVRRRVAGLMDELSGHTRFQLGSAAERRGLLGRRTAASRRARAVAGRLGSLAAASATHQAQQPPDRLAARRQPHRQVTAMPAVVLVGAQWGDEGKGKATDLLGQPGRLRREVQRRQQRRPHRGHRRREVRPAPAALRHPLARLRAGHRQRRRRRPRRAVRGARRTCRRAGVDTSRPRGQFRRPRHRGVQPGARQGDRALPREPPDRHDRPRHRADLRRQDEPASASGSRTCSTRASCGRRSRARWS